MGVVHKLKDEVVSFILAQKKQDPAIGVRKLALLASEKFQIDISKSSINNVLKSAELSSAVGRRAGGLVKSEKFSIPPARKTEILKNMRMAGFVTEHESIPEAVKNPPEDIKTKKIRAADPPPIRTDLQGKEQPEPVASKAPLQEEQIPARSEDESTQDASQDFDFLEQVEKFRALQKNKGAAPLR